MERSNMLRSICLMITVITTAPVMGVSVSKKAINTEDLGDKDQVLGKSALYQYVNLQGGGQLIELTKAAMQSGNFNQLDEKIASRELQRFMYDDGRGKHIPVARLIEKRNKEHPGAQPILNLSKKWQSNVVSPESDLKFVCWRLEARGGVGETILHLCCLICSEVHVELARRLLRVYPSLAQDIYLGDLYYGESCLHVALVNENITLVKLLVRSGANVNQQCCGSYFMTSDQQETRRDTYEHEWYRIRHKTNYEGLCYFGEYPLSFAACLRKPEVVLYLHCKGADINLRDTNGNTALHMSIIHNDKDMFQLLYELGADTKIRNRQGYTVLSLSAALGRVAIFHLIIGLERQVSWKYVTTTCARYELDNLDSINPDGSINTKSCLHSFVNKSSSNEDGSAHSLDGLITVLMHEKWKRYGRFGFYSRLVAYVMYMVTLTSAFYLRPAMVTSSLMVPDNSSIIPSNLTVLEDPCFLLRPGTPLQVVRFMMEGVCFLIAFCYIIICIWHAYILGLNVYADLIISAPGRVCFFLSCLFIIAASFGRIPPCFPFYDDVCVVFAILLSWPYSFFFLRASNKFGKFIAMIYRMMASDLLVFILIYAVSVVSFSEAMHIIYIGYNQDGFQYGGSIFGTFVLSLGEMEDIYATFDYTRYPEAAKLFFVIFMINAGLLQLNLFIAMMGHTFTHLDNSKSESFRQWYQIILILEQDLSNASRRKVMMEYSTPGWTSPDSRAVSLQTQHDNYDDSLMQVLNRRHERYKSMVFMEGNWKEQRSRADTDTHAKTNT